MDSRQMNNSEIEETAAVWIARRDRPEWSDADEAALDAWLHASTAHTVAFIRLDAMWREANRLQALGAGVRPGVVPPPGAWRQSPFFHSRSDDARSTADGVEFLDAADEVTASERSEPSVAVNEEFVANVRRDDSMDSAAIPSADLVTDDFTTRAQREDRWRAVARLRALAASLVVATVLGTSWYLWPRDTAYQTPIGGVEAVALSDGSNVTLNTNSEIRVAVTNTERRIELKHGEAFFDVAKDPSRPFIVMAGGQQVVAVGTKFSVRRVGSNDEDVRVVVTEGRVRVGSTATTDFSAAEVAAGSVARASGAGVLIENAPPRPVDEYVSWRSGYLVFRETPLAEAVAEFNRYNARQIVIRDPAVASIQINGNFRSTNVDAFVRLIEDSLATPIRAERLGEQIVLTAH